jgi:hypothetical protein
MNERSVTFREDVRIVLASADFSKELTTSVLGSTNGIWTSGACGCGLIWTVDECCWTSSRAYLLEASDYLVGLRGKATEAREARRKEVA